MLSCACVSGLWPSARQRLDSRSHRCRGVADAGEMNGTAPVAVRIGPQLHGRRGCDEPLSVDDPDQFIQADRPVAAAAARRPVAVRHPDEACCIQAELLGDLPARSRRRTRQPPGAVRRPCCTRTGLAWSRSVAFGSRCATPVKSVFLRMGESVPPHGSGCDRVLSFAQGGPRAGDLTGTIVPSMLVSCFLWAATTGTRRVVVTPRR
jgi:hypothetical protein